MAHNAWFNGLGADVRDTIIQTLFNLLGSVKGDSAISKLKEELENDFDNKLRIKDNEINGLEDIYEQKVININREKDLQMREMELRLISISKEKDLQIKDLNLELDNLDSIYEEKMINFKKTKDMDMVTMEYDFNNKLDTKERQLASKDTENNTLKKIYYEEIHKLNEKFTSNKIGRFTELFTIDILETNYPKAIVNDTNVGDRTSGEGDIYFEMDGVRCMIESKSHTISSLQRSHVEQIGRFQEEFKEKVSNGMVDFGIFVAPRCNVIPHRGFISCEFIETFVGNKPMFYVAGTFEHQERLIIAVETGVSIVKNLDVKRSDTDNILMSINNTLNDITEYGINLKEKKKIINMLQHQYNIDSDFIIKLTNGLKGLTKDKISTTNENKILDISGSMYTENKRFTLKSLIAECETQGITKKEIYKLGGLKAIKDMLSNGC